MEIRIIEIKECKKDFMCQDCKQKPAKYEVWAVAHHPSLWTYPYVFFVCEDCVKKYRGE